MPACSDLANQREVPGSISSTCDHHGVRDRQAVDKPRVSADNLAAMQSGDVVAGRFEIERLAARGGMGSVYRARDRHTGEAVAVKLATGQGDAQSRRWAREASLLAQVAGPGVVRYVAHGREPAGDLYLAME